jgi:hypothetical protein
VIILLAAFAYLISSLVKHFRHPKAIWQMSYGSFLGTTK